MSKNNISLAPDAIAKFSKNGGNIHMTEEGARACTQNLLKEINTVEDLFLYCASLNYLNAYVKKNKGMTSKVLTEELPPIRDKKGEIVKRHEYSFKKYVNAALVRLMLDRFDNCSFESNGHGDLVLINVCGVQFSFHKVKIFDRTRELMEEELKKRKAKKESVLVPQEWGGIRLQPIAAEVYGFAKNLKNLTEKEFDRETTEKSI